MNDEYLWNKTGIDAEIEGLENALKAFSYSPTAPPELSAKTLVLTLGTRRNFFRFGFALAFASAAVVIASIVWFLIPNTNIPVTHNSAKAGEPQPAAVLQADALPAATIELPTQKYTPAIVKTRETYRRVAKPVTPVVVKARAIDPPVKLTDEEKYAYGQLMLALSITESKLKIVKDAIAGNEGIRPVVEKGKNLYQK